MELCVAEELSHKLLIKVLSEFVWCVCAMNHGAHMHIWTLYNNCTQYLWRRPSNQTFRKLLNNYNNIIIQGTIIYHIRTSTKLLLSLDKNGNSVRLPHCVLYIPRRKRYFYFHNYSYVVGHKIMILIVNFQRCAVHEWLTSDTSSMMQLDATFSYRMSLLFILVKDYSHYVVPPCVPYCLKLVGN